MWDLELVCELAAAGLERRARELDEEGAVRGIDCLSEVQLHAVLRDGLAAEWPDPSTGEMLQFGVLAEQRYPGDALKPRRSEGERCDIVLLPPVGARGHAASEPSLRSDSASGDGTSGPPGGTSGLPGGTSGLSRREEAPDPTSDPHSPWNRRLLDPLEAGTLFQGHGVPPEDALWIEVKVAAQFAMIDGVGRANPGYSSTLLTEVPRDARKLTADPVIRAAAVLIVMFNANEATAKHDLDAWQTRGNEKGWPIESATSSAFAISDRIGNSACSLVTARARPAA